MNFVREVSRMSEERDYRLTMDEITYLLAVDCHFV